MTEVKQVLTIAGTDSGGGAGIHADLKTFQERYVYGMSVVVAVTAQNTVGVQEAYPLPHEMVQAQLDSVFSDFDVAAVKTGMLFDETYITLVADEMKKHPDISLIVDPVMIAKGGARLMADSGVQAVIDQLMPIADVITPNIPEAEQLLGQKITNQADMLDAAKALQNYGVTHPIIKGGHLENEAGESADLLLKADGEAVWLRSKKIATPHTHGTGDTFAATLTAELAKGHSIDEAFKTAKAFVQVAITDGLGIGTEHGPLNHWAYRKKEIQSLEQLNSLIPGQEK